MSLKFANLRLDQMDCGFLVTLFFKREMTAMTFCLLIFLMPSISKAQLSGTITDSKTGKPLQGVDVFVNKTTIGTLSDEAGQFTLENVLTGIQEIVLYKKGYSIYRSSIKIQANHSYNLKLSLNASKRKKTFELTDEEKTILNSKLTSEDKKISDEKLITINKVNGERILTSESPLIIQNDMTGYRLRYFVMEQSLNEVSQTPVKYEFLPVADLQQNIVWEKNRKKYFQGSQRHWLLSLLANQLKEEGYSMQNEKGDNVDAKSCLSSSSLAGYSKLTIDQPLTISYKGEDGLVKTSRVLTNKTVDVNEMGQLINSKALVIQGNMSVATLADQLPVDYRPIIGDVNDTFAKTLGHFFEKIYVHTDKPYYYPGETLWFKGYINYKELKWRDSLSKVAHVELIDPHDQILLTKTLRIDSGYFFNDFSLSDTLSKGSYYLRAYTNFNRNHGDEHLFVKPIFILNKKDKVDPDQNGIDMQDDGLKVVSDKQIYKPREKISLTINTCDIQGNLISSNLSVAVTDEFQVVPIANSLTIKQWFSSSDKEAKVVDFKYSIENGISFSLQHFNRKGKPAKTILNIIDMGSSLTVEETDDKGVLLLKGFQFYDSAGFVIKAEKSKDLGKVKLIERGVPSMKFSKTDFFPSISKAESSGETDFKKESKLLNEVVVTGRKIENEKDKLFPGFVIRNNELNKSNVLYNLTQLPGSHFKVDLLTSEITVSNWLVARGAQHVVPVAINGQVVFPFDQGGSRLASLNSADIEVIYVTRSSISVFTKDGVEKGIEREPNFQLLTIPGYSRARNFACPDYDNSETNKGEADYRSTIYWNPKVLISKNGETTVSFFAADLPGKYRIVVEGINETGEPIRSVSFIEVDYN